MIKLRVIAYHNGGDPVKGLTVPKEICAFYEENQTFSVEKSGTAILFVPGSESKLTKKQIEQYDFMECRA